MTHSIIKNIVISLSLLCILSLWHIDQTAKELTQTTSNHLELLSQLAQVNTNSTSMLVELSTQPNLIFLNDYEQDEFFSKHEKLATHLRFTSIN